MTKINALPPQNSPDGADVFPTDDTSDSNNTKKLSLTKLKEWLQSLTSWITTAMIGDAQVTSLKLKSTVSGLAYLGSAQNSVNGFAKVQLNTEIFDEGNNFNTTTYRFTAPVNGVYRFEGNTQFNQASEVRAECHLYKNGADLVMGASNVATFPSSPVTATLKLAAGDYIELYINSNSVSTMRTGTAPLYCFLSWAMVGEY